MLNLDKIINKNNENNDKNRPFRMLIIGLQDRAKLMHYFI